MDLGLAGKVAVVTGGSRGIGRAAAEAFLDEGAAVVVASKNADSVERATSELAGRGIVKGVVCDVSVEADIVRLMRTAREQLGRLDAVVSNAGVAGGHVNAADMPTDVWEQVVNVHLRAAFICSREAARIMREDGTPGRIVFVSSVAAYEGDPILAHYNAAKAGMNGLVRALAGDFADWGIRVNGVAPGWVNTDMNAGILPPPGVPIENFGVLKRVAEPAEIAAAIVFAAGYATDFMTGTTIVVDGGQTIVGPRPFWEGQAR
jgi:2-dehydro-3-deoxy-D-gluconate 5-dehydrogenase